MTLNPWGAEEPRRPARISAIGQQHDELIAAEAGEEVRSPEGASPRVGAAANQAIALLVPVGVVDLLEPVEIKHRDAERLS